MGFETRKLSSHVGAEIVGLDLKAPIDGPTAEALREAFRTHKLLLIRQPGLSLDDQIAFATVFGELFEAKAYKGDLGSKGYYISNTREDGQIPVGELEYHHDHLFFERPTKAPLLYALEIPPSGSVTKFRDAVALAGRLPTELWRKADHVRCEHVMDYQNVGQTGRPDPTSISPKARRAWHPLLWTGPDGERALWAVPISTLGFDGIDPEDGERLLAELVAFADGVDDIEYAHRWKVGDLIIWDNYRLAHARLPFESSEPRTLRRISVKG